MKIPFWSGRSKGARRAMRRKSLLCQFPAGAGGDTAHRLAVGNSGMAICLAGWLAIFGLASAGAPAAELPLQVAATTGMVADLVRQVGGERVAVDQLMGPGVDPHLYKPTASDAARLSRADVIFYTGLRLEGRMAELFGNLERAGKRVHAISASVPEELLLAPEQFEGHFDPHIWMDASLWSRTLPTVVQALSAADPSGAKEYEARGEAVRGRLEELHAWCLEMAGRLPEDRRVLVTSHDAFNYFGRAYGFQVVGLQGVSTVSEAGLADVASLVDLLRAKGVKAIFVETSVNPAGIRRVAEDAGVQIGGELFSDALGAAGEMRGGFDVGTYEGMIRYNMTTIVNALK